MRSLTLYLAATILGILLVTGVAQAGPVGKALGEAGLNEQVQNAGDALQQALAAAATNGNSVRGASGAMGELALNSGSLICNAWLISFHIHIRNMVIESSSMYGETLNTQLRLIRRAGIVQKRAWRRRELTRQFGKKHSPLSSRNPKPGPPDYA